MSASEAALRATEPEVRKRSRATLDIRAADGAEKRTDDKSRQLQLLERAILGLTKREVAALLDSRLPTLIAAKLAARGIERQRSATFVPCRARAYCW
jgi:hypothetical protein